MTIQQLSNLGAYSSAIASVAATRPVGPIANVKPAASAMADGASASSASLLQSDQPGSLGQAVTDALRQMGIPLPTTGAAPAASATGSAPANNSGTDSGAAPGGDQVDNFMSALLQAFQQAPQGGVKGLFQSLDAGQIGAVQKLVPQVTNGEATLGKAVDQFQSDGNRVGAKNFIQQASDTLTQMVQTGTVPQTLQDAFNQVAQQFPGLDAGSNVGQLRQPAQLQDFLTNLKQIVDTRSSAYSQVGNMVNTSA
jgi:hypothetical protein